MYNFNQGVKNKVKHSVNDWNWWLFGIFVMLILINFEGWLLFSILRDMDTLGNEVREIGLLIDNMAVRLELQVERTNRLLDMQVKSDNRVVMILGLLYPILVIGWMLLTGHDGSDLTGFGDEASGWDQYFEPDVYSDLPEDE